jgi:hypothetical protein
VVHRRLLLLKILKSLCDSGFHQQANHHSGDTFSMIYYVNTKKTKANTNLQLALIVTVCHIQY